MPDRRGFDRPNTKIWVEPPEADANVEGGVNDNSAILARANNQGKLVFSIDSTGPSSPDAPMRPCSIARTVVVQLPSGVKKRSWIVQSVMILPGNDREYGWITHDTSGAIGADSFLDFADGAYQLSEVLDWTVFVDTSHIYIYIFFFKVLAVFTTFIE